MKHKANGMKTLLPLTFALSVMLFGVGVSNASPITYNVDQTIGLGSVIGTITTDGNSGILGLADITNWNLNLNGVGASFNLQPSNSAVWGGGSDLTATPTQLLFNYSGSDGGFVVFQDGVSSGWRYYCNNTTSGACLQSASVVPEHYSYPSAQFATFTGNVVIGTAAPVPEPESYAMLLAGLGLLGFMVPRKKSA